MDPRRNGARHDHDAGGRILLWWISAQEKFYINDYPVVRRLRTGEYPVGTDWVLTGIWPGYWGIYRQPAISWPE